MHANSRSSPGHVALKTPETSEEGVPLGRADGNPPAPPEESSSGPNPLLSGFVDFFSSMRLTVACLALGLILVFAGTLAQVELGLYKAQNDYFRSFFVYWQPSGASWKIPVLPGGYLVGGVLLLNLIASHFRRFRFTWKKSGIWLTHIGLILLLLGQLLTDLLSRESSLHLRHGETKNYSEADRTAELAIVDVTDPGADKVISIPQDVLMREKEINHAGLPFTLRVNNFYVNSQVENRDPSSSEPPAATRDIGARATLKEMPRVTVMDRRDVPSAVIEIVTPEGSLGTWLATEFIGQSQTFTWNNRTYQLSMRPLRFYKPFSIQLLEFRHDLYPGTQKPKNFSSRVLLHRPDTGEKREVLIYMNNPLRYEGETFYQASFDRDNQGTILQVVRNPSWLTPYISCILVGLGLLVQFTIHLWNFSLKRKTV